MNNLLTNLNNSILLLKKGGKSGIHIKKENRGKFTALKKRTGHSASWFKKNGTPAQRKMATFALNARHWNKKENGGVLKAQGGIDLSQFKKVSRFGDRSEFTDPEVRYATLDDMSKFTAGFETYSATPYERETSDGKSKQKLAGYGSTKPYILQLANEGKLTEEIAMKELRRHLQEDYDTWNKLVPNFKNLDENIKWVLAETSYNGKGVKNTIENSPKLMEMINSGVTDPKQLVKELDHSKSEGGWLGVRSSARRAIALGEYNWDWDQVDSHGRQVDTTQYKGPKDWRSSPYYQKYNNGGRLKRK